MIPKVIHYCWFGENPLPELPKKCIESWKKYCPDYEIIEWNENNYDFSKNKYMQKAYEKNMWAFVSDFARLDIIYNYGGIYLDTDVELVKSLDDFLDYTAFAGMESEGIVAFGLGFGAEKGNDIVKEIMDKYLDMSFDNENGTWNLTTSPTIQTSVFREHGLMLSNIMQNVISFTLFPTDYFCPKDFKTGKINITKNTVSIHHFDSSWHDDYSNYAKKLIWKASQFLPHGIAKPLALIVSNIKYFGLKDTLNKIQDKKNKK